MTDEASRLGPRLYGLFNDLEDGPSVDNDQSEGDSPTLDEILQRTQLNGLDDPQQT